MPIDAPTLLAFAAASLAVYLAPGADMAYIASASVPHGLRAGAVAATGTVLGVFVQALAAASGATAIFLVSPVAFELVRWAGVAYLCWLGIRLLRAAAPEIAADRAPRWRAGPTLLKGFAINLLNPKISLFFLAFLPQFVDPGRGSAAAQVMLLGLLFAVLGTFSDSLYALLAGSIGSALRRRGGFMTASRWLTGGTFIGLGVVTALAGSGRDR